MAFLGFLLSYGAVIAAGVALAFAVAGVLYVLAVSKYERYAEFLALAGAGSDGDSDADCRANLNIDRSTHPLHRAGEARPGSILGADGGTGVGRHDADRNPVRTDAASVA